MIRIIVLLYSWLYFTAEHLHEFIGTKFRLADSNASASVSLVCSFIFYIIAFIDFVLPINSFDSPYFWIIFCMILLLMVLLMYKMRNIDERNSIFAKVKQWREGFTSEYLCVLEVITLIVFIGLMLGGLLLWVAASKK